MIRCYVESYHASNVGDVGAQNVGLVILLGAKPYLAVGDEDY